MNMNSIRTREGADRITWNEKSKTLQSAQLCEQIDLFLDKEQEHWKI
jgi:hypothetical protein